MGPCHLMRSHCDLQKCQVGELIFFLSTYFCRFRGTPTSGKGSPVPGEVNLSTPTLQQKKKPLLPDVLLSSCRELNGAGSFLDMTNVVVSYTKLHETCKGHINQKLQGRIHQGQQLLVYRQKNLLACPCPLDICGGVLMKNRQSPRTTARVYHSGRGGSRFKNVQAEPRT